MQTKQNGSSCFLQHSQRSVFGKTKPVSEEQLLIQSRRNEAAWTDLKNVAPRLKCIRGKFRRGGTAARQGGAERTYTFPAGGGGVKRSSETR